MISESIPHSDYLWNAYYVPYMLGILHKLSHLIFNIPDYFTIHMARE